MTRYIIAFEGQETVRGQYLEHGCLQWTDEPIPVSRFEFNFTAPPVGVATDLQRDEKGQITAAIAWFGEEAKNYEAMIPKEVAVSVYCKDVVSTVEKKGNRDVRHVQSARIQAITPTLGVPWAGLQPGDDLK